MPLTGKTTEEKDGRGSAAFLPDAEGDEFLGGKALGFFDEVAAVVRALMSAEHKGIPAIRKTEATVVRAARTRALLLLLFRRTIPALVLIEQVKTGVQRRSTSSCP